MSADDAWGGQVEGAPTTDLATFGATPDPEALERMPAHIADLSSTTGTLLRELHGALAAAEGSPEVVLDLITWCQALRRSLSSIESDATRWAGLANIAKTGDMPDGRRYTIRRGTNRKAWNHDRWKHDARAAVVKAHNLSGSDLLDPETGELVDLQGLLTHVQEFHGSTSPRLTALRQAGLDPDDYAETSPGAWGVEFVDPNLEDKTGSPE